MDDVQFLSFLKENRRIIISKTALRNARARGLTSVVLKAKGLHILEERLEQAFILLLHVAPWIGTQSKQPIDEFQP